MEVFERIGATRALSEHLDTKTAVQARSTSTRGSRWLACAMAFQRKDYLERVIEQVAQAIARILKLSVAGEQRQIETALEETSLALFGVEYRILTTFDAPSVVSMLGDAHRVEALVKLLRAEADAAGRAGDAARQDERNARAEALLSALGRGG